MASLRLVRLAQSSQYGKKDTISASGEPTPEDSLSIGCQPQSRRDPPPPLARHIAKPIGLRNIQTMECQVLYIVLIGTPAILAAGVIWFLADMRERDEILKRLRKVQAEKRKVF